MAKKVVSGSKSITSTGGKVSFQQKSGTKPTTGKYYTYKPTSIKKPTTPKVTTGVNSNGGNFTQGQINKVKDMIKKKTGGRGVKIGEIAAKYAGKSNSTYMSNLKNRIKKKKG